MGGRYVRPEFCMANADSKSSLIVPGEATSSCWSCGTMRAQHFCSACGKVQPAVPVDYFTFFGFPRKLDLDTAVLEKEFYALSRRLHPDVFARAQPTEKARATGELKKQVVPPDLLEEVFELNMHLEELRMQKKAGEDDPALLEEIGKAKLSLEEKFDALFNELKTEWNNWDKAVDSGTEEDRRKILDTMLDVLNRRNYVRNLVRDVNEVIGNLLFVICNLKATHRQQSTITNYKSEITNVF